MSGLREFHVLKPRQGRPADDALPDGRRRRVRFDHAIFADTQEEPEAGYTHLEWLQSTNGPEILVRTKARLGDDLMYGRNSTGGNFASIPAFTTAGDGSAPGMTRRQCSKKCKTDIAVSGLEDLGVLPRHLRDLGAAALPPDRTRLDQSELPTLARGPRSASGPAVGLRLLPVP